jgi:hypothetical protein
LPAAPLRPPAGEGVHTTGMLRAAMKVLFTNAGLRNRAGTELWVRDVALALLRRSHTVAAYSTVLGEVADELRDAGVVVVDRLEALPWEPEVIHGHHHAETMTALVHFGGVPAIYVCHGVAPWQEAPPLHPRVMRYVAVTELVREMAVKRHGVPPERLSLMLNFVDLEEFPLRADLPDRPRRALLFSNQATPESLYPEVSEGCRRCGLELDAVGRGMGNPTSRPGDILGRYDLVFAVGRAALEALACGTAVIVCGAEGMGPLVDTGQLDRLRRLNFGIAASTAALTPEEVARQIGRYDAADAARTAARVRQEAGLDQAVERLLTLYGEALTAFAETPGLARPPDPATAAYITALAALVKRSQRQAAREARGPAGRG